MPALAAAALFSERRAAASILAVVVALASAALLQAQLAQPSFPRLTGRVVDEAGLLTAQDAAELTAELADLEAKSTDQLVVVTLRSLQGYEIEDFGYRLGRAWGIGQAGTNNGVLLIVAPNERKVRIEVGRGLEPQLTDALSRLIIENAILPAFRRGNFAEGIKAGVRDIKDVLLGNAEEVRARAQRGGKRSAGVDPTTVFFVLFWLAIVAFVIYAMFQQAHHRSGAGAYGRRVGQRGYPVAVPGGWGGSGG
ncbi:MAG TPA: TPM domain-containing protein, partial [Hyphomicrobiaceae bacterium]|nr:TPM domain-containing protein [Hyphomicrobiaceae bacterium]